MIIEKIAKEIVSYIKRKYGVNERVAENIARYFIEQHNYSVIPTDKEVLVEIVKERNKIKYYFHTLVGRKANDALSRAFAYVVSKRKRTNVGVVVTDYGFMLILPKEKALSQGEILQLFMITDLRETLKKALQNTEMLKRIFRQVATTGLMILRRYAGKKKSVNKQQLDAERLLRFLQQNYPDFPLLKETYRTILEDKMDIENAETFLTWVQAGKIKVIVKELEMPSPFAWGMELFGSSDAVLMEDRKELLKEMHKKLQRFLKRKAFKGD